MDKEKRQIGDILKEQIMRELIEPSYYGDVNETIKGRKCWRVSGHVFESMSKILLAASGVISFAAGVYDDKIMSFIAGTLSTISLATFQFSLYSFKQHKKNSMELNLLLEKINIETVPIFEQTEKTDDSPMFRKAVSTETDEYDSPMFRKASEDGYQKCSVESPEQIEPISDIEMVQFQNTPSLEKCTVCPNCQNKSDKEDKKEDKKEENKIGEIIEKVVEEIKDKIF
jgi:hypothetical protein